MIGKQKDVPASSRTSTSTHVPFSMASYATLKARGTKAMQNAVRNWMRVESSSKKVKKGKYSLKYALQGDWAEQADKSEAAKGLRELKPKRGGGYTGGGRREFEWSLQLEKNCECMDFMKTTLELK